jgi:hypothetical protein
MFMLSFTETVSFRKGHYQETSGGEKSFLYLSCQPEKFVRVHCLECEEVMDNLGYVAVDRNKTYTGATDGELLSGISRFRKEYLTCSTPAAVTITWFISEVPLTGSAEKSGNWPVMAVRPPFVFPKYPLEAFPRFSKPFKVPTR